MQRLYTKNINVKIYRDKLFSVNNNNSYNFGSYNKNPIDNYFTKIFELENMKLSMVLKSVIFRIPIIGWELRIYHFYKFSRY